MTSPKVKKPSRSPGHSGRALQSYMARSMGIENDGKLGQMVEIYPQMQMKVESLL